MLSVFKKNDFQPALDSEEGKFFAEGAAAADRVAAAAKQSNGLTSEVQSDTVQAGQAKNMARSKYIQKHDDADFGYRIISQLTSAQYKRRKELGQYACDLSSGNAGGGVVLADYRELDKKRNTLTERSTYDNSPVPNTGGNAGVQLVGSRSSQQQGGSPISGVRIDGRSERHTSGSADSGVPTRQGVKKDTGNSGVSSLITIYEKSDLPAYVKKSIQAGRLLYKRRGLSPDTLASLQLAGKVSKETLIENVSQFRKQVKVFKERNKIHYSLRNVSERQTIVDMRNALPYEVEHNEYFAKGKRSNETGARHKKDCRIGESVGRGVV
jgi:hypothetical protein